MESRGSDIYLIRKKGLMVCGGIMRGDAGASRRESGWGGILSVDGQEDFGFFSW